MAKIVTLTLNPAIDLSATVEEIAPFRKLRCTDPRRDPGGGGINVARVLRRWDCDVLAIFPAGGPTGTLLERLLTRDNVPSRVIETEGDTREDFTVFDRKGNVEYRFVLPGPEMSEATWRACLEPIEEAMRSAAFFVASGSLPPGASEDVYAQIARLAKSTGTPFVLDTSGAPLAKALEVGVHLVKPNRRELSALTERALTAEADWLAAGRALIERGRAELVALTLADQGALLVTENCAWRARVPKIAVTSTVGAGDSFLAGFIWRLSLEESPASALSWAVAAGSAALLAAGTELATPEDAKRLLAQVSVEEVRP